MSDLPGRKRPTAPITGASGGIGRAFAVFLAEKGYDLILTARREEQLREVKEITEVHGGRAHIFSADLSVPEQRDAFIAFADASCDCPDLVINNAGFGVYDYFVDQPWELVDGMLQLNVMASFKLTHHYLQRMKAVGGGHIINIGSVAGQLPMQGVAAYAATKAAVHSLSTSLWREARRSNVKISVIAAGPIKTDFFAVSRENAGGLNIPVERFAVSQERVLSAFWSLIRRPRRVVYVPWIMRAAPWVEAILGIVFDLAGPLVLEYQLRRKRRSENW